jgi:hypothetical protein
MDAFCHSECRPVFRSTSFAFQCAFSFSLCSTLWWDLFAWWLGFWSVASFPSWRPLCSSVKAAISSSVTYACSSIALDLHCFAVSLFCLFSRAYSAKMNVLMFIHVLSTAALFSHSCTTASNFPDALKW